MQNEDMLIKIKAKSPDVAKKLEGVVRSLEGVQVHGPGTGDEIALLILELGEDPERDFWDVEALLKTKAVEEVFVTSRDNSPETLMKVIRTGAKEFLSQPLVDEEVRQALLRCKERRNGSGRKEPEKVGRIVSVIGSKGGVGTTTVAVNLAVSMAQGRHALSVALIDMNLLFGEIPIFLEMKPKYHWGEIAKQVHRLDSDFLMNILSKHPSGIYVLPSPAYYHYDQEGIPKIIGSVLQLARSMFDVVVIDGGHYLGKISSKALEMSDEVLLLSAMSLPCLSNTNNLLESFRTLGYPMRERVRIVVNRYEKRSEISLKDAEESVQHTIFWTLPNDYKATMTAINQGKPLGQIAPRSKLTKSVKSLADNLLGEQEETRQNGKWSFLRPWKGSKGRTGRLPTSAPERRAA